MNNGLIALKFYRGAVSIEEYIYMYRGEYGTYGKFRAIKGKYAQIRVTRPKCSQI